MAKTIDPAPSPAAPPRVRTDQERRLPPRRHRPATEPPARCTPCGSAPTKKPKSKELPPPNTYPHPPSPGPDSSNHSTRNAPPNLSLPAARRPCHLREVALTGTRPRPPTGCPNWLMGCRPQSRRATGAGRIGYAAEARALVFYRDRPGDRPPTSPCLRQPARRDAGGGTQQPRQREAVSRDLGPFLRRGDRRAGGTGRLAHPGLLVAAVDIVDLVPPPRRVTEPVPARPSAGPSASRETAAWASRLGVIPPG